MSLSLANLPNRVLEELKVIEVGGDGSTAKKNKITDVYNEVHAALVDEGIIDWGSSEAIPDNRIQAIVAIVGDRAKLSVGASQEVSAQVALDAEGALSFLWGKAAKPANKYRDIKIVDY